MLLVVFSRVEGLSTFGWARYVGFFWKKPWKRVLQEQGRFTALGEAARSHTAAIVPAGLVQVSMARTAHMPKRLGQMCQHTEVFLLNSQSLPQAIGFADTAWIKLKNVGSRRWTNPKPPFEQCYQCFVFCWTPHCAGDKSQWRHQWWKDPCWDWDAEAQNPHYLLYIIAGLGGQWGSEFEGFLLLLWKAGLLSSQAHKSWQTASGFYPVLPLPQAWSIKYKCIITVSRLT